MSVSGALNPTYSVDEAPPSRNLSSPVSPLVVPYCCICKAAAVEGSMSSLALAVVVPIATLPLASMTKGDESDGESSILKELPVPRLFIKRALPVESISSCPSSSRSALSVLVVSFVWITEIKSALLLPAVKSEVRVYVPV